MGYGQYSSNPRPADESRPAVKQDSKKRLRHIFDNPAHVWAHPLQKDGPGFEQTDARVGSGNWYFKTFADGIRVIYSYRDNYPIGSRFEHGRKVIFLLRAGKPYSVTTSGHMNATRQAVPRSNKNVEVFTVPEMTHKYRDAKPGQAEHKKNLQAYLADITEAIECYNKARSSYHIRGKLQKATDLTAEARRYAHVFKVKLPALPKLPELNAAQLAQINERERIREEKKTAEWKAQREAGKARHILNLEAWKRGEAVTLHISYGESALLRVKNDNVETSQGADVPISGLTGAARLFRFLTALKAAGRTYQSNGHSEHIGAFAVNSFDGETLVAGCHRITWAEIESVSAAVLAAEKAVQS